jgi:hypothetical protein
LRGVIVAQESRIGVVERVEQAAGEADRAIRKIALDDRLLCELARVHSQRWVAACTLRDKGQSALALQTDRARLNANCVTGRVLFYSAQDCESPARYFQTPHDFLPLQATKALQSVQGAAEISRYERGKIIAGGMEGEESYPQCPNADEGRPHFFNACSGVLKD